MPEILPVPGHPGYFVSDDGVVYSTRLSPEMRPLKPVPAGGANADYLYVSLGRARRRGIHQIVAAAFVPKPEVEPGRRLLVRHRDNNPRNNAATNLLWGTQKQNLADRAGNGTLTRGARNGGSKLAEADVDTIRRRRAAGEPCGLIARDYGLSRSQIHRIGLGARWSHIDTPLAPRQRRRRKEPAC